MTAHYCNEWPCPVCNRMPYDVPVLAQYGLTIRPAGFFRIDGHGREAIFILPEDSFT